MNEEKIKSLERDRQKLIDLGAKPLEGQNYNGYFYRDLEDGRREIYEPTDSGSYSLRRIIEL